MGSPLAPVGTVPVFIRGNEALRGNGRDQAYPVRSRRESERGDSKDASAAQPSDYAPDNSGSGLSGSGFYQVAASLVLQYQLYDLGASGATAADPADNPAGAGQAAPGADAGANATSGANADAPTPADDGTEAGASTPTAATSDNNNTSTGEVTGGAGTPAASSSSATLKQEEAQLQQALQALGLNPPAAIQEFMQAAQLLAEISPGMFQEFVSYVSQLAKAAEPTVPAGSASGATGGAPVGTTSTAAATPSAGSNASTPQIQFEVASVQVTQAEVSITSNQNGGETLSVAAQSETATFAELQLSSQAASASTSAGTQSTNAKNT
ncbi:MAG: hypothetical protein ACRD19_08630 [Terriglobia bacterium]